MADFSPAAQTVLDAYHKEAIDWGTSRHKRGLAAALRAAADQVVPEESEHAYAEDYELGCFDARLDARNYLLSIAAELRGTTTTETP